MAELMEQRDDVIPEQQRGLSRSGLLIITDVVNHRLGFVKRRLFDKIAHPCAAAFRIPGKEIAVKKRQPDAVMIENFPDAHIRMVDRNIKALDKFDAKQLVGGPEHPFMQNGIQFEIRFELRFI